MTIEIATSAPRGGNHMGQVGVIITDHMITKIMMLMFQIQIMSVGVQLNLVSTISGDEVCELISL